MHTISKKESNTLRALYRRSGRIYKLKSKLNSYSIQLLEKAGLYIPGFIDIESSIEAGSWQWVVYPDGKGLARVGLNPSIALSAVGCAYGGLLATSLQTPEREVFYRVILDKKWRQNLMGFALLHVRNKDGYLIPVKRFVSLKKERVPLAVRHIDGVESILLSANIDAKISTPR